MHSGSLVSVVNQAEGDFVASLVKESGTSDSKVWIGLYDPNKVSLQPFYLLRIRFDREVMISPFKDYLFYITMKVAAHFSMQGSEVHCR